MIAMVNKLILLHRSKSIYKSLNQINIIQKEIFASICKHKSTVTTEIQLQISKQNEITHVEENPQKKITLADENVSLVKNTENRNDDPITMIPPQVRHLQDTRVLYSSLFPKSYRMPISHRYDLRDKHIDLVKSQREKNAASAIVEMRDRKAMETASLVATPQDSEVFPYAKSTKSLLDASSCDTNKNFAMIEKNRIQYESLPELDSKKELAALLDQYEAGHITPINLNKNSPVRRKSSKYCYNVSKPSQSNASTPIWNQSGKNSTSPVDSGEELLNRNGCPSHSSSLNSSIHNCSYEVPAAASLKNPLANVCSVCNTLLGDLPLSDNLEQLPISTDYLENPQNICQSCSFDAVHKSTLQVVVRHEEYLDVLRPMCTQFSLVLLVLDLMDAPCSIHPSIMEIIGRGQPVIIVANKFDLLPRDSKQSLRTIWHNTTELLKKSCLASANIIDTVLVSAKTGFGITQLSSLILGQWRGNGDIFLLGSAGCGKTTLFKALLQSFGSHQHHSLTERVEAYKWPLSNLNLLKFELDASQGKLCSIERNDLIERTVRPFKYLPRPIPVKTSLPAPPTPHLHNAPLLSSKTTPLLPLDENGAVTTRTEDCGHSLFTATSDVRLQQQQHPQTQQQQRSVWLRDTPSAVMPMQILDLLTEDEIKLVRPRATIQPQTFRLGNSRTLLLAGLARIDVLYLHHPKPLDIGWTPHNNAKLTVYCAKEVPRTVVKTVDAASVYRDHLGDEVLMVPRGSPERLGRWAALEPVNFTVTGPKLGVAAADIVLPSLGFVSVWLHPLTVCSLRVWTAGGRGAVLRAPSLLPYGIHLKGKKQRGGIVYDDHEVFQDRVAQYDPSQSPTPDRLDDVDHRSIYVKIRDRLGYQSKEAL